MNDIRVSLIIPTYNYGRFLARCVDAALAQTVAPLEVIVVDDGSTDNTRQIMRAYEGRVQYVWQADQGLSSARNTGARSARGDWFLFCDADDYLTPRAVEWLTAAATDNATGVVYGKCLECYEDGRIGAVKGSKIAAGPPPVPAKANFWKSVITTTGAALIRRRTFNRVGGYTVPWIALEDREFWLKAGMRESFAFCDEVVLRKSTRNDSLVSRKGLQIYWGMVLQLDFLTWCGNQHLDASVLGVSPQDITENAIKFLVRGGHVRYIGKALAEMARRNLPYPSVWRAVLRHGVPEWLHQTRLALGRLR